MTGLNQLLVTFFNPLIVIMALVFALSVVHRRRWRNVNTDFLMGAVFSLAVVYTLAAPIDLPNGGQYDMRGLIIGVAAAMFGIRTAAIVLTCALVMRIGIGNPGLVPGIVNILIAFCAGISWHRYASQLKWPELVQSVVLALVLSLNTLAIFFAPSDRWVEYFTLLVPYTVVCNLMGVTLIRYLVHFEMNFLSSSKSFEEAASTDHLTGLHNRRSLEEKLSKLTEISRTWRGTTAICFDLDKFKTINDTYGHAAGDAVLQVVSSRLASTFRAEDIFCRLGGDEFVVILPNLPKGEARNVAERCRVLVAETPVLVGNDMIKATISVGAVWTEDDADFQMLLSFADEALYKAKSNGRNAVAFAVEKNRDLSYTMAVAA